MSGYRITSYNVCYTKLLRSFSAYSQDSWDSWNKNYRETDVADLLNFEKTYADSVDQGLIEGKYYMRMDFYRFSAQFTGKRQWSEKLQ